MPKKKSEKDRARARVLSDEEILMFWRAMDVDNLKIDIFRQTKLALKMILLTGQRPGEVIGMRWDEIDAAGNWNIPAERMKGKTPQTLPLCTLAREILEEARLLPAKIIKRKLQKAKDNEEAPAMPDKNYIFCSSHGKGPAIVNSMSKAVRRHHKAMGIKEAFTPHDLRRTVRTKLAEIGVDDIVAEKIMAHKLQGVMGIYNRHSYLDEKRAALMRWEAHLKRLVGMDAGADNGKVVTVQFGRK